MSTEKAMYRDANHRRWQTHRFRAMGSEIAIWLDVVDAERAHRLLQLAEELFSNIESCLSRFREESELSMLNRKTEQWVPVSDTLWAVVGQSVRLARETNGLYDPSLLHAMHAAGYTRSYEQLGTAQKQATLPNRQEKDRQEIRSQEIRGRWQFIRLDEARQSVWLPHRVGIDLGGIGKGWTAQRVVTFLNQWGACLVDAGGDLTAGDAPAGWPGWPVGIAHPASADEEEITLARLLLHNGSLATSGVDYRHWLQNGERKHHLIDPRTGRPAGTDLLTVSVLATDACRAEAWATAALVAGQSQGFQMLSQRNLAAALIRKGCNDGSRLLLTPTLRPLVQLN